MRTTKVSNLLITAELWENDKYNLFVVIVSRELGGLELFRLAEPRVTILMSVASPKCRPPLNLTEEVKRKRRK